MEYVMFELKKNLLQVSSYKTLPIIRNMFSDCLNWTNYTFKCTMNIAMKNVFIYLAINYIDIRGGIYT